MIQHAWPSLKTEPPRRIDAPEALTWDAACDVLVVGFGAAGAATAIAAREAGADVKVLDRFGLGGATARSGGVVYAGGGTAQQQAAGCEDDPDNMFRYLSLEVGDAVRPETLRRFCQDSPGLIQWLESMGARFDSDCPPPKTSYPPDGTYLYYSGNEKLAESAAVATPAPRGHRIRDAGLSGRRLFEVLRSQAQSLDIPVETQAAVTRLVVDASNAVLGVEYLQLLPGSPAAQRHARLIRRAEAVHNVLPGLADRWRRKAAELEVTQGQRRRIRARRGVVLSTGGFIFNQAMVLQHAPNFAANMRLGTTGCDGSGIRLGRSVGGAVGRMHKASAWRFINPPSAWSAGVVVNQGGRRFCVESAYGARIGVQMCEQHTGRAWLILDRTLRRRAWREALTGGLWIFQSGPAILLMLFARRARSLARLAGKLGVDAGQLEQTIRDYNAAAQGETRDTLGKLPEDMQALTEGPFTALDLSRDNPMFPLPTITLGGLQVDESNGAVLNEQGQPIPGLFAAGRAAVGIASNNYLSGLSLADCLWSGRRAGQALSQTTNRQQAA